MSRSRRTLLSTLMLSAAMSAGGVLPSVRSMAAQGAPAAAACDFRKLSQAARRGMLGVGIARSALFEGKTEEAARLIHDARIEFAQARNDDTAFLKPEAELAPPADLLTAAPLDARVIAWLPYGGEMIVLDSLDAGAASDAITQRRSAAMAEANAALRSGRRTEALHLLEHADIGVVCRLDVVPLEATLRRIEQADSLMRNGRYYEAGQILHRIERSGRHERVAMNGVGLRSIPTRQQS